MARKSNTRNAQGAGSIRQRKDGRWEARYTPGRDPGTGKQIQRSVYGATQEEVAKKLRQVTSDIDKGVYVDPTKLTVSAWLDTWHKDYIPNVKDSTRTSYEQHIRDHLKPAFGAVKLVNLHPAVIQKMINALIAKGLSPKTVRNIKGTLHSALEQAIALAYIRENPASKCTLPRVEKAEICPLDTEELQTFVASISEHRHKALFSVAVFTGMREGELLGLQWSCVNFDRGTILIDKQLSRPRKKGDAYKFGSPKNDKPRTIRPAPHVMQLLKDQKKRQNEMRLRAGGAWEDGGFPNLVFTDTTGCYIKYCTLLLAYKTVLEKAGIEERRFHDLRHTYAVMSLRAGDDIKTVQENLGHHTAAFTLDQYGHVSEEMRKASADRMQALITGLGIDQKKL